MAQTLIAFDFGTKSIGVSVGEASLQTASELKPLKAKDGIPDWLQIERLLQEWQPAKLLVGLPLNMDGSEQEMTRRARKFANRLHARFQLDLELIDERLSTREAKNIAAERGHSGDYSNNPVDSIAARLILESYWNSNK
jgi:putative Holliday junction resolvase